MAGVSICKDSFPNEFGDMSKYGYVYVVECGDKLFMTVCGSRCRPKSVMNPVAANLGEMIDGPPSSKSFDESKIILKRRQLSYRSLSLTVILEDVALVW